MGPLRVLSTRSMEESSLVSSKPYSLPSIFRETFSPTTVLAPRSSLGVFWAAAAPAPPPKRAEARPLPRVMPFSEPVSLLVKTNSREIGRAHV